MANGQVVQEKPELVKVNENKRGKPLKSFIFVSLRASVRLSGTISY